MTERPNTLPGLIDKRREPAGRIEHAQRELRAFVADLDYVDAVIRIFDPDAIVGPAKRFADRRTHRTFDEQDLR